MNKIFVVLLTIFLPLAAANRASADDVTAPIHQFLDGFNGGDTKSALAAFADESISITDEFAPHLWVGRDAAHEWAAEYDRHAHAAGVSEGVVQYSEPTRKEIEGDLAYVVIPTVYSYNEHGRKTKEEGQMTFVLRHGAAGWKIKAWTWTGAKPHSAMGG